MDHRQDYVEHSFLRPREAHRLRYQGLRIQHGKAGVHRLSQYTLRSTKVDQLAKVGRLRRKGLVGEAWDYMAILRHGLYYSRPLTFSGSGLISSASSIFYSSDTYSAGTTSIDTPLIEYSTYSNSTNPIRYSDISCAEG